MGILRSLSGLSEHCLRAAPTSSAKAQIRREGWTKRKHKASDMSPLRTLPKSLLVNQIRVTRKFNPI